VKKQKKQQYNFEDMPRTEMARAMRLSTTAISQWSNQGCPHNASGTYSLADVIAWKIDRSKETSEGEERRKAEVEKLQTQVKLLQIELRDKTSAMVPKSELESTLGQRAHTLSLHLHASFRENAHVMEMKSRDDLYPIIDELVEQSLAVYIGNKKGD
jgi:phage terminase Nu1 subunit (DNA packaging protein)